MLLLSIHAASLLSPPVCFLLSGGSKVQAGWCGETLLKIEATKQQKAHYKRAQDKVEVDAWRACPGGHKHVAENTCCFMWCIFPDTQTHMGYLALPLRLSDLFCCPPVRSDLSLHHPSFIDWLPLLISFLKVLSRLDSKGVWALLLCSYFCCLLVCVRLCYSLLQIQQQILRAEWRLPKCGKMSH